MDALLSLMENPRVTVRQAGTPDPEASCGVYWMQRAQWGVDNAALDVAVNAAHVLGKPAVVFSRLVHSLPPICGTTRFWLRASPTLPRHWRSAVLDSCYDAFPIAACGNFARK